MAVSSNEPSGKSYTQIIQLTNPIINNAIYSCAVVSSDDTLPWTLSSAPFRLPLTTQFTLLPTATSSGEMWMGAFWINAGENDPPTATVIWTVSPDEVAQLVTFDGCQAMRSVSYCSLNNPIRNLNDRLDYYVASSDTNPVCISYNVNTNCQETVSSTDFIGQTIINCGQTKLFQIQALPTDCICFAAENRRYSASTPVIKTGGAGGIILWNGTGFQLIESFTTCSSDLTSKVLPESQPPPSPDFSRYWWAVLLGIIVLIVLIWLIIHMAQRRKQARIAYYQSVLVVPEEFTPGATLV